MIRGHQANQCRYTTQSCAKQVVLCYKVYEIQRYMSGKMMCAKPFVEKLKPQRH